MLQKSSDNRELFRNTSGIAWVADGDKAGEKYVALFNPGDDAGPVKVPVQLQQLGFTSACKIRDLWSKKDLGEFTGEFAPAINKHGAGLYRIMAD